MKLVYILLSSRTNSENGWEIEKVFSSLERLQKELNLYNQRNSMFLFKIKTEQIHD